MLGLLNARWPQRLAALPWAMVALVAGLGLFGAVVLYAAAGGRLEPWAANHLMRLGAFLLLMLGLSQVPLGWWLRAALPLYALVLAGLVLVELVGAVRGGAQRWLDLGIIGLQPSELMKIALVLALARFYHALPEGYVGRLAGLAPPLVLILIPVGLLLVQPDLGTALTLVAGGLAVMFLAGLPLLYLLVPAAVGAAALPLVFQLLHPYQQKRVLTFLDPSVDPLGAGYHITQSKIAIGSGGLFGRGFLQGTQAPLDYLPERHTDFVFATMAEEWGLAGGLAVLLAYGLLLGWGARVALASEAVFARLLAGGLVVTIFLYVAINMAMVMGMAPVVGIPLPLVSYGGNAMLTVMLAFGILLSLWRERDRAVIG